MDDERVWTLEKEMWTGSADQFDATLDPDCLMVVPTAPFVMEGRGAIEAISHEPRWAEVIIAHGRIARPQEGLIVVAYKAYARRGEEADYQAWCTSTYRRIAHDDWKLVQHQQMHAADGPLRGG